MQIWRLLFQRLQAAKTARFVRGFLVFLSHYVVKRGPAALQASTDTVQPGIFLVILQQARAGLSICAPPKPAPVETCCATAGSFPLPTLQCLSQVPISIEKSCSVVCPTPCSCLADQSAVSDWVTVLPFDAGMGAQHGKCAG